MVRDIDEEIRRSLVNWAQMRNLWRVFRRRKESRDKNVNTASIDTRSVRRVKETSLERIRENLEVLRGRLEGAGSSFYLASDAKDAVNHVLELLSRYRVRSIIKTKSMTTEEIGLNAALETMGYEVVETDIGEFIIQVSGDRPSHILSPAAHLDRHQIAEVLERDLGVDVDPEPRDLVRTVRETLRAAQLGADVGITGANVIVAETGSIILVTNEGNDLFVTTAPKVLICVSGIEKVVYDWRDALTVLKTIVTYAGGKKMTSYVTVYGPKWSGLRSGQDSALHVILVDNGRFRAMENKWLREGLMCVRCASCFNLCPTYTLVGGHVFGSGAYSGPIGILWTAVTKGVAEAADIAPLCISCGLCLKECPVGIDIPMGISWIKSAQNSGMGRPSIYAVKLHELFTVLASKLPRLANVISESKTIRALMELSIGIDRRRPLPRFEGGDLYGWYEKRFNRRSQHERKIVYFPDTYTSYVDWTVGKKLIELLDSVGVKTILPRLRGSGMPYIQNGLLKEAASIAERNVATLYHYAARGVPVICTEPTALYCLREVYTKLLETPMSISVANLSLSFGEYLLEHLDPDGLIKGRGPRRGTVFYHVACHSTFNYASHSIEILRRLGYDVEISNYGCCGMAGTWGYRRDHYAYEMSTMIGRRAFESIDRERVECVVTDSSVCKLQLRHLTRLRVLHTIDLLSSHLK
ncbi:MAG: LUD domain-containing protein [Aigarchaeota archaeon]|nr:LUD domain-containing protein [Aigarchaeota archaeon]MDW8092832.1 LUD domain-containing protein [Nitrososphaerota archaeon]